MIVDHDSYDIRPYDLWFKNDDSPVQIWRVSQHNIPLADCYDRDLAYKIVDALVLAGAVRSVLK